MAQMSQLLARFKIDPIADLPIGDHVNQVLQSGGVQWRDRLLTPLVTLRLFMIQILHGNCAIAALRQLCSLDFAVSSYCEARARLPLQLLESLLVWINEQAQQAMAEVPRHARRILIADGSNYSMPGTPELSAHFDLAPGTRPGVGYPMGKLMGLLDAATGLFISLLALPLFEHDSRSLVRLHSMLTDGDILLADRAFCSYAHLAMLQARRVLAVMRLHQRRKDKTHGRQRWQKPDKPPGWMQEAQWALLPQFIDVRIVGYTIEHRGFRTRHVLAATTLMDEVIWPDQKIAELYGHRWNIETCFDHLKTTMKMNVLRCQSVLGVMKELAMYLAVYNLVRLAMLKAAAAQHVDVWRISFIDALRQVAARMIGLRGVAKLIVNPRREGRSQLRVIRRRLKEYDLLNKPRRQKEAELRRNKAVIN
jgi:DDE family transposase